MKINQLKVGVILSYVSIGLGSVVSMVYTPAMLRLLGQSEYGLYTLAGSIVSYLSLLSMGFGSSYVRFYSKYKVNNDQDGIAKLNGMYMTLFTVIGIVALIAGGILTYYCDRIFDASLTAYEVETTKKLMVLLVFNIAISFPFSIFTSYITANEQYVFQKLLSVIKVIANPIIVLSVLFVGFKSVGLVVATVFLNVTIEIIHMIFCLKKLKMRFEFKSFDFKLFKEMAYFSIFIFINIVVDQINWNAAKFMLGIYWGSIVVAVYGVASQLNNYYLQFSSTISSVFIPKVHRIVATTNSKKELTELFTKVGRVQFAVLALVASGLVFFGKPFILKWGGPEYGDAYPIVLLMILPVTIPLIQNLGIEIQRAQNLHQFRSLVYLSVAVVNIAISLWLCPKYGGIGCAIGTAFSILLGNGLIMNIYYHKKCNIDIIHFWKNILRMSIGLVIPIIFGSVMIKLFVISSIPQLCCGIIAYTVVYSASMWVLGINNYEKQLVKKPFNVIIQRFKK